jgi:hypothetical protein
MMMLAALMANARAHGQGLRSRAMATRVAARRVR